MFTQIFHLADIHIRKGNYLDSRYTEYLDVINNTILSFENLQKKDESICVLCGDIFHHKLQISSHGIVLFYKLVYAIADMMPIVIIQGNHDLIQENNDENNDLIKALLDNNTHKNIHYCDKTSSFDIDNIHFGIVSIRDMLDNLNSSGLVKDLPPFPEAKKNMLNIALSHATVQNCLLHNYSKTTSGIPVEWFKDYDMALLGDIHLQSVKCNKKHNLYYGYPGSLVQQDFGESLYNHGFLVWNIDSNNKFVNVDKHHVYNNIGRSNVKVVDDEIFINAQNYIKLNDFLQYDDKPLSLKLKLFCKDNASHVSDTIIDKLNEYNINATVEIVSANLLNETSFIDNEVQDVNIEALNSSNTIKEFFKSYGNEDILTKNDGWENYFDNIDHLIIKPNESIPTQIKEQIEKKNDIISKKIETESKTIKCNNNLLKINEISFDWILAFGKDNRFTFSNNRISLINAPNGYGKSAFYECIILGLFGEPIPSRYMKSSSLSILNKRKKHKIDSSNINIKFSLNNIEYSINRVFYEKDIKGVKRLQFVSIELYENNVLIKTSANLVNKWVHENICTVQDFLLSTMITQNFDNDFFKMKVSDQIELLDNVLHMDHINHICDVFKDAKKEYKDLKNHIDTYIKALKPSSSFNVNAHNDLLTARDDVHIKLINANDTFNSIHLNIKGCVIDDTIDEPIESIDLLLNEELRLNDSISKLNVGYNKDIFAFVNDLSLEQFIDDSVIGNVSKNIKFNKSHLLYDLVKKLRDKNDLLHFENINLHNLLSSKPFQPRESIDEYNQFIYKFNQLKLKCKGLNTCVPIKSTISINDLSNMKKTLNKKLFKKTDSELLVIINKVSCGDIKGKYNSECWACNENFGSIESSDAKNIINFNDLTKCYNEWNEYLKIKTDLELFNSFEQLLPKWNEIIDSITIFDNWDKQLLKQQVVIKDIIQTIVDSQFILKESYSYQVNSNKANELYKLLDIIVIKKSYYVSKKLKSKFEIDNLYKLEKNILINITTSEINRNKEKEYNDNKFLLNNLTDSLTCNIELFNHFTETFKKYKYWIYNEKLLPVIVNKTNQILNTIFKDRLLELGFQFIDDNLIFTVIDEDNTINMEKLSGAQSFAVSLSFRLSLSSIGISKFRCRQLFIDEGFSSFDHNNLLNVPSLIKNLKHLYDEIILVTHLDEIKGCADFVVNITRNNGISQILS